MANASTGPQKERLGEELTLGAKKVFQMGLEHMMVQASSKPKQLMVPFASIGI